MHVVVSCLEIQMKITPDSLTRMEKAMKAVVHSSWTKAHLLNPPIHILHNWWWIAFKSATYPLNHPDMINHPPIYRDESLPLYPDNSDDSSLLSALKKICLKLSQELA